MLYPIYCAHMLVQADERLVFRILSGKLCIFQHHQALILSILQKSTGTVPSNIIGQAVSSELGISPADVLDAIDDLMTCGILADSHNQILMYHTLTYNPPQYPSAISLREIDELTATRPDYRTKNPTEVYSNQSPLTLSIESLLARRHSCRSFQEDPVERNKLFALCRVTYGRRLSPVASAGGLFPLSVYLINRVSGALPTGLYQYDPEGETLLRLGTEFMKEALCYALNDEDMIFRAPCIFFICGEIGRHMKKYANRGYRYTLLEVGHAVQNMTLAAAELGLGGVEYGGFCDEAVRCLFQLPEEISPLACYATGYEANSEEKMEYFHKKEQERRILEQILCGRGLAVKPRLIEDERFASSNLRVMVTCFQDETGRTEFGTGVAAACDGAYTRSVMEAYERYALSRRYYNLVESADRLDGPYLDPNEFAPYSEPQLRKAGFVRFRTDAPTEWLRGYTPEGDCVYIPADLCFDVASGEYLPCHVANTSGCAANFDVASAERSALLELIERDAVMRTWFYQLTPCRFCETSLPDHIQRRFRRYQEQGVALYVLLLPCEYAYTVLVCSVGTSAPPYFVSGAAASFTSAAEAITKAFNEWEISFVLGETTRDRSAITEHEVISPSDHGDLYRWGDHNDKIEYLLNGPQISVCDVQTIQLRDIHELSPIFCAYRPLVNHAHVIRAFSKELIPINFGFGMDFWGHCKVEQNLLKQNKFPHFFA